MHLENCVRISFLFLSFPTFAQQIICDDIIHSINKKFRRKVVLKFDRRKELKLKAKRNKIGFFGQNGSLQSDKIVTKGNESSNAEKALGKKI